MKTTLLSAALLAASLSAHAVDGEILVTQAKALAGNVTPGDAPGFPVTLSLPGKYKLAGNLTVPDADTTAVLITTGAVTLDLNGFAIQGPVTCTPTIGPTCSDRSANADSGIGIDIAGDLGWAGITVQNGLIKGMGGLGVRSDSDAWGIRIHDLSVINNARGGLVVHGAVVSHSLLLANDGPGLEGFSVLLTESQASNNNGHGMSASGARGGNFFQSNHGSGGNVHVTAGSESTSPNVCGSIVCP